MGISGPAVASANLNTVTRYLEGGLTLNESTILHYTIVSFHSKYSMNKARIKSNFPDFMVVLESDTAEWATRQRIAN